MKRLPAYAIFLAVAGCAPPYVWGDVKRVKGQLLEMVPRGSELGNLERTATRHHWVVDERNIRTLPAGTKTYFEVKNTPVCRSRGGPVVPILVARYFAPFKTTVETLWLFDARQHLEDVCVQKPVAAL